MVRVFPVGGRLDFRSLRNGSDPIANRVRTRSDHNGFCFFRSLFFFEFPAPLFSEVSLKIVFFPSRVRRRVGRLGAGGDYGIPLEF